MENASRSVDVLDQLNAGFDGDSGRDLHARSPGSGMLSAGTSRERGHADQRFFRGKCNREPAQYQQIGRALRQPLDEIGHPLTQSATPS